MGKPLRSLTNMSKFMGRVVPSTYAEIRRTEKVPNCWSCWVTRVTLWSSRRDIMMCPLVEVVETIGLWDTEGWSQFLCALQKAQFLWWLACSSLPSLLAAVQHSPLSWHALHHLQQCEHAPCWQWWMRCQFVWLCSRLCDIWKTASYVLYTEHFSAVFCCVAESESSNLLSARVWTLEKLVVISFHANAGALSLIGKKLADQHDAQTLILFLR